jgi:hypothetical protein
MVPPTRPDRDMDLMGVVGGPPIGASDQLTIPKIHT